jgi:hypothetical protein
MARELLAAVEAVPSPTRVQSLTRQIRGWEKGEHFPQDWRGAYARAFGQAPSDLFGQEDRPPRYVGSSAQVITAKLDSLAAQITALLRDIGAEPGDRSSEEGDR